jgi:hypothetical protein
MVIASQDIPLQAKEYVNKTAQKSQFHHLGWVNTKHWAYALDLYFDSSPRGSCNNIFEAVEAGVPVIMADSSHNRESSALPYLQSAVGPGKSIPGVYDNLNERVAAARQLLCSTAKRADLANAQLRLLASLKGCSHLFAKDYLNYFLDTGLSLGRK